MVSAPVLFRRPVKIDGGFPKRRHVMFGNCGAARGHTAQDLKTFLVDSFNTFSGASGSETRADNFHFRCEVFLGSGAVSNVSFESVEVAEIIVRKVDGKVLNGCVLNVCYADRSDSPTNSTRQLKSRFGIKKKQGVPDPGSHAVYSTKKTDDIAGLKLYENFVSDAQAGEILEAIYRNEWDSKIKRRVQHYGYEFNYLKLGVDPNKPIGFMPDFCYFEIGGELLDGENEINCSKNVDRNIILDQNDKPQFSYKRLPMMDAIDEIINHDKRNNLDKNYFDQLTINEYHPGIGIGFHVDTHSFFDDYMAVISLGDPIVLEFRKDQKTVPLFVPSNSLLLIGGEARYAWKHGIASRNSDPKPDCDGNQTVPRGKRVSLTFRRVTPGKECKCQWRDVCDSQTPESLQLPGRLGQPSVFAG